MRSFLVICCAGLLLAGCQTPEQQAQVMQQRKLDMLHKQMQGDLKRAQDQKSVAE